MNKVEKFLGKRQSSTSSRAILLVAALTQAACSMTYVSSTEAAWTYSRLGSSISDSNYYPTSISDFAQASEVGYVTYWDVAKGWFVDRGAITGYHIFSTWCTSSTDTTINFINGGDDGHAVFVDGAFLGGNGFGVNVTGNFSLAAGVSRQLVVVTHNAGGEMHSTFFVNPEAPLPLESKQGITLNAVPEPSSAVIFTAFTALGLLRTRIRR